MNRVVLFGVVSTVFMLSANCSQQGPSTSQGTGGGSGGITTGAGGASGSGGTSSSSSSVSSGGTTSSSGTGSGGASGSGGTSSPGGTTSLGGTSAVGGTTSSGGTSAAGGTKSSGGATGSGGASASGGVTSAGGTTAKGGTTGPTASGGTTGSGGTMASGGATSSGGATTATGGTKGTGGATGSGGSSGTIDPTSVVPDIVGYMWIGTCSNGSQSGLDCPLLDTSGSCPNPNATDYASRGLIRTTSFTVKGTQGTPYTVHFEARGVLGSRCYTGGTPEVSGLASNPETSNNGWHVGGQPVDSLWNTYEIHVSPAVSGSGAANPVKSGEDIYYMNAFPYPPISYGKDTYCEAHETFPMKYTASFQVTGGSTISLVLHDSNCKGQMNCGGPDNQSTCANPRTVDLTGMSPPPSNFTQPYRQSNGFYPQWVMFANVTVTSP